ncbi:MAG: hydrogenase/urease maturation nickel metallochaperone HypA [Ignavibacteriales bacterium]
MHEISAAQGVLQGILEECSRSSLSRVKRAEVTVNAHDGLSPENIEYWFQFMSQGTSAEGATLVIRVLAGEDEACPRHGDIRLDLVEGVETDTDG